MRRRTSKRAVDLGAARVTPQQAADGLLEFVLPDGQHILVDLRDGAAGDPEIEAEVIQLMLNADADADLCGTVEKYADASGLKASFFLGNEAMIVAIGSSDDSAGGGPTRTTHR